MSKCQITDCTIIGDCSDHKCFLKGCSEPKASLFPLKNAVGKVFCLQHMCQVEECLLQAKRYFNRCSKHTCGKLGCREPISTDFVMCENHRCPSVSMNSRCINDEKCPIHVCENSWCKSLKKENSKYCSYHLCISPGCKDRVYDGKTCEKHGCHYQVGFEDNCGKLALEGSNTCLEHKCCDEECLNPKVDTSPSIWCRIHRCHSIDCDMRACPKTNYCERHGCGYPGCSLSKLNSHVHRTDQQKDMKASEALLALGVILLAAATTPSKR